jgi:hypothetical protein
MNVDVLDLIAAVLVAIPLIDWACVYFLTRVIRASKRRHGYVPAYLSIRRHTAFLIALSATGGAILGVSRLFREPLPPEIGLTILTIILILPSLANADWLVRALRGDFGGNDA